MTRSKFNQLKTEATEIKAQLEILDGSNSVERKTIAWLKQRLWQIIEELNNTL